jgi:hypothetical protein
LSKGDAAASNARAILSIVPDQVAHGLVAHGPAPLRRVRAGALVGGSADTVRAAAANANGDIAGGARPAAGALALVRSQAQAAVLATSDRGTSGNIAVGSLPAGLALAHVAGIAGAEAASSVSTSGLTVRQSGIQPFALCADRAGAVGSARD